MGAETTTLALDFQITNAFTGFTDSSLGIGGDVAALGITVTAMQWKGMDESPEPQWLGGQGTWAAHLDFGCRITSRLYLKSILFITL